MFAAAIGLDRAVSDDQRATVEAGKRLGRIIRGHLGEAPLTSSSTTSARPPSG